MIDPSKLNWDDGKHVARRHPDRPDKVISEEAMIAGYKNLPKVLHSMGFSDLRPGQKAPVMALMAQQDLFCIMPTSGGKSATFAIPTLCMGWKTLVFEPLVSLMRDQVTQFSRKGLRVAQMSGMQSEAQNNLAVKQWVEGKLDLLYVAPERLNNGTFKEGMQLAKPDMVVVDEAHCFPGDTEVYTEFGLMRMSTLWSMQSAGVALPNVWSRGLEGVYELKPLLKVYQNSASPLVKVEFAGGSTLRVTGNHLMFTPAGPLASSSLPAGIEVITIDRSHLQNATVSRVTDLDLSGEPWLYDLEVKDNHNYFVRTVSDGDRASFGVLVHNCTSNWGHNFRPEYCHIGDFAEECNPKVLAAFTATANPAVEKDVRRVLGLGKARKVLSYYRRDNLDLRSQPYRDMEQVAELIEEKDGGSAIVYFTSIKRVEENAAVLSNLLRREVTIYHGELPDATKASNQDRFMADQVDVICATSAFGMGVDKPTTRLVIHPDLPGTLDDYAQGAGRAGRDDKYARCELLFSEKSIQTQQFFIRSAHPTKRDLEKLYHTIKRKADPNGICQMTAEDLAFQANLENKFAAASAIAELVSNRVIERASPKSRTMRVAITGSIDDARFTKWIREITTLGKQDSKGFYEIDREFLLQRLGVSLSTLNKYIKQWHSAGYINFIPPFRGSLTRISGDIRNVDFDSLEERRKMAEDNLETIIRYASVPNEEKHAFMENYFNVVGSALSLPH